MAARATQFENSWQRNQRLVRDSMYVKAESSAFASPRFISPSDTLECDVDIPTGTHVRLILPDKSGRSSGYQVEITYQAESPADVDEIVASVSDDGRWPTPHTPALLAFVDAQSAEAERRMDIVLDGIRWRLGATGILKTVIVREYLSIDGIVWRKLFPPPAVGFEVVWGWARKKGPDTVVNAIKDAVVLYETIPLSRELFAEAFELHTHNPRSALVMLVAAAEVGFKEYVSKVAPDAAWLISKVPSPPLSKMVEEYLPTLPANLMPNGRAVSPPKAVRRALHQANEERNKIVHKGRKPPSRKTLREYLDAVSDFLYLLDYYGGHRWAWELVSAGTLWAMRDEANKIDKPPKG